MAKAKKKATKSAPAETRTRRVEVEPTNNDSLTKKIIIVALVLFGLYLLLNFIADRQSDQGEKSSDDKGSAEVEKSEDKDADKADEKDAKSDADSNGTTSQETDQAYTYVVGAGESYTTMARRAIASVDSSLTTAERVAAETKLTSDANAQWLSSGQQLTLSKDAVRAAIGWAKGLSAEQKAAWQPYADLIAW